MPQERQSSGILDALGRGAWLRSQLLKHFTEVFLNSEISSEFFLRAYLS